MCKLTQVQKMFVITLENYCATVGTVAIQDAE